jgi:hypothetical protein
MTSVPYGTSNVYLASFLLCQGADFLGFERPSRRRFVYRFGADEKLHELLRLYWSVTPINLVPAVLFDSLRRLKSHVRGSPVQAVFASLSPATPSAVPPADHAESIGKKPRLTARLLTLLCRLAVLAQAITTHTRHVQ